MDVNIDFRLSYQFGVVERIIFRFALNGFHEANEIYKSMPIFSDTVIANAIKNLVNRQIITVKIDEGTLEIAEPVLAIINMCLEKTISIDVSPELQNIISQDGLLIGGCSNNDHIALKRSILAELLPNVKLDLYTDSLDFIIKEKRSTDSE